MWPANAAAPLIGMGCMRLSTERDRDDARAIDVLHAAFDAGVTFLDTADSYCWDEDDAGYNERLIACAIATWFPGSPASPGSPGSPASGDRSRILVATKGGLTRPHNIDVFAERGEVLRRYAQEGWRVLGLGWQPGIAEDVVTAEQIEAGYARMQELLGVAMDILYCPHGGSPPICWCRKPLPGLGVVFIQRYRLDPLQCIYVGSGPQDPGFARRLGFQYRDALSFFS